MGRDRWFKFGVLGSILACVACLTPAAVLMLGTLGLAAWAGYVDVVVFPVLGVFLALALYRAWCSWSRRALSKRGMS